MELELLLNEVSKVIKQNQELSALKGENFNVFQIFEMEGDENKMHSRFINTLLDPRGRHGRGAVFLKLFLETLNIPDYFENIENVSTKVEHPVGEVQIDGVNSTGGRIDIFIWDNNKSISIENKIYAGDQENQIVRYCNYKKSTNRVYYLNLYGTEPEGEYSKGQLKSDLDEQAENHDFYCISYYETILNWLEKCQKEAADFPVIRETIKQYIITIKRLTGQLINQNMKQEIEKLIAANFESASIIAQNIDNVKTSRVDSFLNELKDSLEKKLGDNWTVTKEDIKQNWSRLTISHKNWFADAAITLQGQPSFMDNKTIIGLPIDDEIRQKLKSSLNESDLRSIKTEYSNESKVWFFYGVVFNFGENSQFAKLLSTAKKEELIESLTTEIHDLANKLKEPLKAD